MARSRITDHDLDLQRMRVERALRGMTSDRLEMQLHLGNSEVHVPNRLIVNGTNVWPDYMAGTTKREAWNALRIMAATMTLSVELREIERGNVR